MLPIILGAIMIALVFFGAGVLVESWHMGALIEKAKGENTVLSAANDKCAEDVGNTRAAMTTYKAAAEELERQAAKAVQEAAPKVAERTRTITKIKELPQVAPDMQCEAIKQEQIEYVQERRK